MSYRIIVYKIRCKQKANNIIWKAIGDRAWEQWQSDATIKHDKHDVARKQQSKGMIKWQNDGATKW